MQSGVLGDSGNVVTLARVAAIDARAQHVCVNGRSGYWHAHSHFGFQKLCAAMGSEVPRKARSSGFVGCRSAVDERSPGFRIRDVLQGRSSDGRQGLLGEERLVPRDENVRKCEETLKHVVLNDLIREILKEEVSLLLVNIQ